MYKYQAYGTTYFVKLEKHKYTNGRTAVTLVDAVDGEQVACATVNLPEQELAPGEVFIKTWSENAKDEKHGCEGMLEFLVKNGIVRDTGREVPTGYVTARVCVLL
jgi:hypothetical protein